MFPIDVFYENTNDETRRKIALMADRNNYALINSFSQYSNILVTVY